MFHFQELPNGVCVLFLSVLKRVSRLPHEIFFILCYVINTSVDLDNLTMHQSSLKIKLYIGCGFL